MQTVPKLSKAEIYGLTRSCIIYYAQPWKWRRLLDFYGQFIQEGDLCFDIGAHVGNRSFFWRKLNAKVVAVEPHEATSSFLSDVFRDDHHVSIINCAMAAKPGSGQLHIDPQNPTINTISTSWQTQLKNDKSWQNARWEKVQKVQLKTLDQLIEKFGLPKFCKIDAEGSELAVLQGLSQAIPVTTFEYIPICVDQALACIERLEELGSYRYNWSPGESLNLALDSWLTASDTCQFLRKHCTRSSISGDIIALLQTGNDA